VSELWAARTWDPDARAVEDPAAMTAKLQQMPSTIATERARLSFATGLIGFVFIVWSTSLLL
jgi:hypothetical protein